VPPSGPKSEAIEVGGENPLLAFVSSQISADTLDARQIAVATLDSYPGVKAWLFEEAGASSEEVVEGYLRKVRESDLVVWLVGSTLTEPVRREIRTALSANVRILMFRIAAEADENTETLVREVPGRWTVAMTEVDLRTKLQSSIAGEFARAWRSRPPSRQRLLRTLDDESRLRCIERWVALGLDDDLAGRMASDAAVGDPAAILPCIGKFAILTGELGSGKSLIGERVHQEAIRRALAVEHAPLPVFLETWSTGAPRYVGRAAVETWTPTVCGAIIYV